jgi:microcystin-dependent protein
MFGTVLEISVTSGATLTTTQTQNGVIRFTGTLISNVDVSFPNVSGVWQIDNRTTGNYYVRVKTATGANQTIGLPQGVVTPIRVESGTDGGVTSYPGVSFVNSPLPGTYWDYGSGTTPVWFGGCTSDGTTAQLPWIVCDGSTYNITSYPYLGAILGSTFGGNGVTTFGVPDLRNRARVSVMSSGARLTSAVSGIDGTVVGSGGSTSESTTLSTSQIPAHNHSITDLGHTHTYLYNGSSNQSGPGGGNVGASSLGPSSTTQSSPTGITINNTGGGGAHTNVQPTIVAGLTFIKT